MFNQNNERFYLNFDNLYNEDDYFERLDIEVFITIPQITVSTEKLYEISSVQCNNVYKKNQKLNLFKYGTRKINRNLTNYLFNGSEKWQLFYLYKELTQLFENTFNDNISKNFYRGQAHNWPMKAGLFRDDIIDEFKVEFENIYQDIAYKYPDIIQYKELKECKDINSQDFRTRELDMAYLQHYGLRTTLIDITENPFIALLFLTSNENDFKQATFDMYNISIDSHSVHNIFSRVKMLNRNKRIIAQKGAFFNFEKIRFLKKINENIEKIPMVRVTIDYELKYIKYLKAYRRNRKKLLKRKRIDLKNKNKDLLKVENERKYNQNSKDELQTFKVHSEYFKKGLEIAILRSNIFAIQREIVNLEKELKEIEEKLKIQKRTFEKYVLPIIRNEIREKLKQFHYVENELFPDIYKHLNYIQNDFLNKNNNDNNIQLEKDSSTSNIMKLL